MDYSLITAEHFNAVPWSGGTTTELFIFPAASEYRLKNFQFRLSTARVDLEKSDFTSLPGVSRKIMILSGTITLNHDGQYSKKLRKFDTDEFHGEWKTSSVGKCTDFNLMTTGKTAGTLSAVTVDKDRTARHVVPEEYDWFFIYLFSGKAAICPGDQTVTMNRGDLLAFHNFQALELKFTGIEPSELILSSITG